MKLSSACAGCFAGLSCGTRIEILNLLSEKDEMSVLEIAHHFQVTQPTITHHLKYLREVGLLSSHKEGTKVFYSLSQPDSCKNYDCEIFS